MDQNYTQEKTSFTHFNVQKEWVADPRLCGTDWLILAEIAALCNSKKSQNPGWCYGSNSHLGSFIGKAATWVSRRCSILERLGYLRQEHQVGGITLRQVTSPTSTNS